MVVTNPQILNPHESYKTRISTYSNHFVKPPSGASNFSQPQKTNQTITLTKKKVRVGLVGGWDGENSISFARPIGGISFNS